MSTRSTAHFTHGEETEPHKYGGEARVLGPLDMEG